MDLLAARPSCLGGPCSVVEKLDEGGMAAMS
jgi:hypothetical protein